MPTGTNSDKSGTAAASFFAAFERLISAYTPGDSEVLEQQIRKRVSAARADRIACRDEIWTIQSAWDNVTKPELIEIKQAKQQASSRGEKVEPSPTIMISLRIMDHPIVYKFRKGGLHSTMAELAGWKSTNMPHSDD